MYLWLARSGRFPTLSRNDRTTVAYYRGIHPSIHPSISIHPSCGCAPIPLKPHPGAEKVATKNVHLYLGATFDGAIDGPKRSALLFSQSAISRLC